MRSSSVWTVHFLSMSVWLFSDNPVLSHIPEVSVLGPLVCLLVPISVCEIHPVMEGHPHQLRSVACFDPELLGRVVITWLIQKWNEVGE